MHLDKIYTHDLYDDAYSKVKYFNQRSWDVAMNTKSRREFEFYRQSFNQMVVNGEKDLNEYYVLLKLILDGPLIFLSENSK
jgi:hypothetical protein